MGEEGKQKQLGKKKVCKGPGVAGLGTERRQGQEPGKNRQGDIERQARTRPPGD